MQYFQPILIGIGILAIAGVLIHGFFLNRKNKVASESAPIDGRDDENAYSREEYDGAEENPESFYNQNESESVPFSSTLSDKKEALDAFQFNLDEQEQLHDIDHTVTSGDFSNDDLLTLPRRMDIPRTDSTSEKVNNKTTASSDSDKAVDKTTTPEAEVELFIFNIAAKDGQRLGGHELLQFFLTSGFRYGEMNIFHRHEHSDGTGEILFSIANMMAPGTFDLDTIEQFNSPGISFFFTAPNNKISVNKSFDMMLRAVEQVAEEFDCDVLNESREKFTQEDFLAYRDRLQKYE
jgi:cell division protein ZipA